MSRNGLRAFAKDWIVPGLIGLAGAAVLIVGAELGGLIGWLLMGLVALVMAGVIGWAVRAVYLDDWPDDV